MVLDGAPARPAVGRTISSDAGLGRVGAWIEAQHPVAVVTACAAAILGLGLADYATGPDVAFSIFYLIPLSLVAWKLGKPPAYALSAVAAVVWQVADVIAGASYGHIAVPIWNTTARFGVFLLVATLLAVLHDALAAQRRLAQTDPLTGVLNGRRFAELAREAAAAARVNRQPLTVGYVDLDDFKKVNDVLGHAGGDRVLQLVARALDDFTRSTDTVARLGGDEFGLILPATGVVATRKVMTNLVQRIQSALRDFDWPVGLSAGAVTFLVAPPDPDEMIDLADGLMYEAKRAGKGTFRHRVVGETEVDAFAHEAPARAPR